MRAHKGNIGATARHLGIHRSTIYRRLQDHV
ncbi:helix-turn-helix domain-containing protein [Asticcacaulis sp. ZE23SCel15]|nr:helix-turn-helix domain-containing protein [Asticcacaulis sp. ZE23SCel15]WKL57112.1 helix-turn-helix domain-containing protein [Asticcacaulis sp. ZE23SCel15]